MRRLTCLIYAKYPVIIKYEGVSGKNEEVIGFISLPGFLGL
jgi:hypothetical protein